MGKAGYSFAKNSVYITLLFLTAFLNTVDNSNAEVSCALGDKFAGDQKILIIGEITAADPNVLRKCLEGNNKGRPWGWLQINSPGGDVYAAMEIGRLLRKYRVEIGITYPDGQCLSSCVLVFAGAVVKHAPRVRSKVVGIHRPYSMKTGTLNYNKAQEAYQKTRSDVENYLREMNIPISLFSAMERVPPAEIRYLTSEEINAFGLDGTDPVEQEVRDARLAQLRGIPKTEYYRRKAESEIICPYTDENSNEAVQRWIECCDAVSWGLSLNLYKARQRISKTVCRDFDDEEWFNCNSEVMLGKRY